MRRALVVLALAACEQHAAKVDAQVAKLEDFCRATRVALDGDLRALESDQGQAPLFAMRNVVDEMIHHGYTSVAMCVPHVPVAPDNWTLCYINHDFACVAKQVRAYRDALRREGW